MLIFQNRNPILTIGNVNIQPIGDPHLDRKFNSAHPDKRQELTEMHWDVFSALMSPNHVCEYKVIMGDIFDKAKVDESTLLRCYSIIKNAASETNKVIILEGNHDSSKTSTEKTSFDVLCELFTDNVNVRFIRGVETFTIGGELVSFIGWEYHKSISDQIEQYLPEGVTTVFTHVDFDSFGSDKSNCVPFDLLASKKVKYVVNGHEHLPKVETVSGVQYIGTGSIIPFDRSQQGDFDKDTYADLFVTVKEGETFNADDLEGKIVYFEAESFDSVPDFDTAFGVILKKVDTKGLDQDTMLVEVDEISIPVLLSKAAEKTGLNENIVNELIREFAEIESND